MSYSLKSTLKGSVIFSLGQIITRGLSFFLIPLYTRFLLPEEYAILGYIHFIIELGKGLSLWGLHGAQKRFYPQLKNDRKDWGSFLFTINIFLVVTMAAGGLFLFVFGETVFNHLPIKNTFSFYPYLPLAWGIICITTLNQLIVNYYTAEKSYLKSSLVQFLSFLFSTGFILIFVWGLKRGVTGKFTGQLIGFGAVFVVSYILYLRNMVPVFSWKHLKTALLFGLPLILHTISNILHNSIDRVFLERMLPLEQLGFYTLAYQLGMVMTILTQSTNRAWQVNYYDLMLSEDSQKEKRVSQFFNIWLIVLSFIAFLGISWTRELIILFTNESYYSSAGIVPIIIVSYFIHGFYFFFSTPVFYYKKTILLPLITLSAALVNIVLNLVFIPKFQAIGAAYATLISIAVQTIISYFVGRTLHKHKYKLVQAFVIIAALVLLAFGEQRIELSLIYILVKAGITVGLSALIILSLKPKKIVSVLFSRKK